MMRVFNYEALEKMPSAAELRAYSPTYDRYAKRDKPLSGMPGITIVLVIGYVVALLSSPTKLDLMVYVLAGLAIIAIVGFILIDSERRRKIRWTKLEIFTKANKLEFSPRIDLHETGMIFVKGHSQRYEEVVLDSDFSIGTHRFVTDYGKDRKVHLWGYVAIPLKRHLPHIVLDAKANDSGIFGVRRPSLPFAYNKSRKLSLEGDFDKYFTLYAPKEYKCDALYVFTSDLMALLIDKSSQFDAEIVDNKLYFYSKGGFDLSDKQLFERLIAMINIVSSKTFKTTGRYKDEKAGSDTSGDVIASEGRRLRQKFPISLVIGLAITTFFLLYKTFPGIEEFISDLTK